ncbi:Putative dioxygenase subunit beta YeaX [Cytospora mali]|uniref:Dioxygenase subunit beta YeaX n=1 Tax=Cytospora mali TaxID=578113 RepID=A0A194V3G2_CYTMA|nr:Putative dioxygenase subunit beta YeaX [Valsa mali var. pyri (nom. inval.)]
MAPKSEVDLWAPFTSDTILEVRSGRLKKMKGLNVESGIDKSLHEGPVHIGKLGIIGDEHDYTFHGGPDKAVHGYCCSHYPSWQAEFPAAASRFVPGGFGENLVTRRMNERNICIGDVMSVGDPETGPLLQVSLPRQPCFKLNHRFELKNFAPNTWKLSRTGWYYRVLREGTLRAGDEIRLVERKHPRWTIERIQEYLHRNTGDLAVNEELAAIPEFGKESHDAFASRVAKQKAKARKDEENDATQWRDFKIVEKKRQTSRITSFVLEAVELLKEPGDLDEGAHAKIRIPVPGRGEPLVRAYSIVGGDRNRLEFGIALEENSRGGSKYLHEGAKQGDTLQVGRITSTRIVTSCSSHVFVAAGVGITAFLALLEALRQYNFDASLHYAVRSADDIPFGERLAKLGSDVVTIYDKSQGQRLSIAGVIKNMPWNSRLYFCGPRRMMDEALRETQAARIGPEEVHFEAFAADIGGDPFEAVIANKNDTTVKVGGDVSLLEALQSRFGIDEIPSSCEVGNCGTCKIKLRSGRVEHRGTGLLEEDKAVALLSCVSRGVGRIIIEI